MADSNEVVQVAAVVPVELAESLRRMARDAERSAAAEMRLALRAWVDAAEQRAEVAP